jgi:PAS domain S-box-containing protein
MKIKVLTLTIIFILLAQLVPAKELVVGVFDNKPITFYEDGKAQGLYIDVLNSVAKLENWTILYKECNFSECLDELRVGKIQLLPSVVKTAALEQEFSFSKVPVLSFWGTIYTHNNINIDTFADIKGRKVGSIKGAVITQAFLDYCHSYGISPLLVEYPNNAELFKAMATHAVDFIVANNLIISPVLNTRDIKRTSLFFAPSVTSFTTLKDTNLDVLTTIDSYMQQWVDVETSPYNSSLRNWFLKAAKQTETINIYNLKTVVPYSILFIIIIATILLFITKFGGKLNTTAYSVIFFTWTALISTSLIYNHARIHGIVERTALVEAQNIFEKDLLLRSWVTNYGSLLGAFAKDNSNKDHTYVKKCLDADTALLNSNTLMRYSYSTVKNLESVSRAVDTRMVASKSRVIGFNTDIGRGLLEPWEETLLKDIQEKSKTESYFTDENTFNYMHTIYAVDGCKNCHTSFKSGDLVGILSISIPMDRIHELADSKTVTDVYSHAIVYVVGLLGIFLALRSNELRQVELRQSSSRLLENEKKYKDLFMNAPLAYQSLDMQGKILDVNKAWLELLGYKKEEIQGRGVCSFVDERYHEQLHALLPKLKELGYLSGIELVLKKSDGALVCVSVSGRVGYDDVGNFKQTHCVITDISERKHAEEEIKLSNQRKEILLELSQMEERDESTIFAFVADSISKLCDSSISYVSLVNKDEDKITQVAYNGVAMKGCAQSEKLNVTYNLDKCGVWADCLRQREAVFINDYPNYTHKRGLPEGHVPVTNHMNVPVFDGNKIVAIFGVGNKHQGEYSSKDVDQLTTLADNVWRIIQRKRNVVKTLRLEKQLREAQKMEAIGTLSGGLSHDFNNILQIILGYSDLIMLDLQKEIVPKKEYMQAVVEAANKGARLTGQLKYFSEKEKSFKEPISLNNSIESTVSLMQRTMPKMINITYFLAKDLAPIRADIGQMEQVIMNLALNAMHAMPNGGELDISTCNKYVGAGHIEFKEGDYVVLKMRDTGCGIPQENISKIFNPFFTTKKQTTGGSGLGLYVVYGIVKNHDGYITCDSVVGQGTTFCIYLPADSTAVIKHVPPVIVVTEETGGNETILVVDDEESLTSLTENYLTVQGYNVIVAKNGEEALAVYTKGTKVDLVVLDLNMPGMGGIVCLKKLLAYDPKAKVIIASGYSAAGPIGETKAMGALGYLNKPFTLTDLSALIRHTLDR